MPKVLTRKANLAVLSLALLVGTLGTVSVGASLASASGSTKPNAITITNFMYGPMTLKVEPGATVTVTNKDTVDHTITAVGGQFNTGNIGHDKSKTFKAPKKPGTYLYYCSIHNFMKGKLIVK